MTGRGLTVGDLRAELIGWPDETPIAVDLPDRTDPDSHAVLPVVAAGYGDGLEAGSDLVLATTFPLVVRCHDGDCDTGKRDAKADD